MTGGWQKIFFIFNITYKLKPIKVMLLNLISIIVVFLSRVEDKIPDPFTNLFCKPIIKFTFTG